jgi:hypothetical protein
MYDILPRRAFNIVPSEKADVIAQSEFINDWAKPARIHRLLKVDKQRKVFSRSIIGFR